jgi:2,3,4,5-tetrahydropyridine-2-carboxylate N-succinyltransferase
MTDLQSVIHKAFDARASISPKNAEPELKEAVAEAIAQLDSGKLRVAEKSNGEWVTHQWLKKAVLLSFRLEDNGVVRDGYTNYFDKVPAKFADYGSADFRAGGFRVVPNAVVRRGSFIAKNVVLMPSFVNIGAYVDESTMVDTWATVGSCAQIGKNVHLSGGVGIGGVLEPVQANPTIIDRKTGERFRGKVPPYSVVVPGSMPSAHEGGPNLYCAVIVKTVDAQTRSKTSINELLRD